MRVIEATKFLEDVSGHYAKPYAAAVSDMLVAMATGKDLDKSRRKVGEIMRQTMGVAEVLGASITLRQVSGALGESMSFQSSAQASLSTYSVYSTQTIIPSVTFQEALDAYVARAPVTLKESAERTAEAIAELYSRENVVAFAKSAEDSVTREVQRMIGRAMEEGTHENDAARAIASRVDEIREASEPWSEAYARMAFRTNVNTAVTDGRMRQAQDPAVKAVAPAFRYDAVGDMDTRHNHAAMDGVIMRTDNPHWQRLKPPIGWSCRCSLSLVTVPQLRRMGKIGEGGIVLEDEPPAGAHPDPGFRP